MPVMIYFLSAFLVPALSEQFTNGTAFSFTIPYLESCYLR